MTAPKHTTSDRRVGIDPVKKVRLEPRGKLEDVIGYHYGTSRTFLARVTPDGCHLCFSHKPQWPGYLHIRIGGIKGIFDQVHRVAYRLFKGEIPDGMVVRHTCDQPSCLNPDHLILGTHADNVADRVARDRSAKGIENGRAKLTPEDVEYIHRHSEETHASLARRFGVDQQAIRYIRLGRTWKHCLPDSVEPGTVDWNRHVKLSEADIPEIRRLAAEGVSRRQIGRIFDVHHSAITKIINGENWKHVT